ncbi:MAG: TonB-dependent receptor [Acidobacteria bacterium]|nr:TonB-dependent receptor [Acidobacteriota bacterium]
MNKIQLISLQFSLCVLVLIGLVAGPLAQGTTGSILGVVQDQSQAVLPGVTVTATSIETNQSRTAISDDEGRYRLPLLPVGPYEVQAELTGFSTEVRRPINLTIGSEAVVNFTLGIGALTERVVVTGEAALVETSSAVTAGLIDAKKIRDLPLNGRDVVQLALLQEGVVTSTKIGRGQAGNEGIPLSLAGTRIHQTTFLLDGTDIRGSRGTVPAGANAVVAGVESVKEFKVITGAFSAEYGRFTGGVITAVTKSGTNQLHGSIYEFHRNSALDARNFFDRDPTNPLERSKVPHFIRNQFGFSLGGPIVKDKTFIFGNFEAMRQRLLETQLQNVPSQEARDGQLTGFNPILRRPISGEVSPRMQPYLDLIPLANGRDLGGGLAEHFSPENFPVDQELYTVRLDHQFSDSDTFFARYTLDQSDKQQFESLQSALVFEYRYQYLTLSEKHIFSPNVINELRVGYTRSKANQTGVETVDVDPSLRFSNQTIPLIGRFVGGGLSSFGNFLGLFQIPNNFSYSDDLSWTKGSHFLKMGANFSRMQFNGSVGVRTNGFYVFTSVLNFVRGEPLIFDGFRTAKYVAGMRQNLFGFYLQDDWKFSPRLTLNLGLRYEFITSPTEVGTGESVGRPEIEGRIGNLVHILDTELHLGNPLFPNPSLKNFSPRIGFAWDPFGNGKTAVRGGFGLFHDQLTSYLWGSSSVFNPPFAERVSQRAANPFTPPFPPIGPNEDPYSGASAVPALWAMGDVKQPYIMQFSLNIQQEIMPNTVFTIAYQGSLGRKLPRLTNDANLAVPVKYDASQFPNGPGPEFNGRTYFPFCQTYAPDGSCAFEVGARFPGGSGTLPKRNPLFGGVRMELWDGNSSYNALRLGLSRRFSSNLQFQFAYNFSKGIDDSSNTGHSDNNGGRDEFSGWSVPDPDDKSTSHGLSGNHVAHTFSANFTYDLPFNPSGAAGIIAAGWQINGIVTLATGPASSFNLPFDVAESQQFELSQRPELKPGASNNPVLSDGRDPNAYYDVNAFTLAPRGFFGNVARNTLISPGQATFDFGVAKSFTLHEETSLQFKAEFFNLFNRANFSQPGMDVFTSIDRNGDPVPDPSAGQITSTTGTSRQIQFALKILF